MTQNYRTQIIDGATTSFNSVQHAVSHCQALYHRQFSVIAGTTFWAIFRGSAKFDDQFLYFNYSSFVETFQPLSPTFQTL